VHTKELMHSKRLFHEAMEQAQHIQQQLEADLKISAEVVLGLTGKTDDLETKLGKCTIEHSVVSKELMHSK
jgi:hypothetical protein